MPEVDPTDVEEQPDPLAAISDGQLSRSEASDDDTLRLLSPVVVQFV